MSADKYKLLLISDHALSTSGVGTQTRWLSLGLIGTGRYRVFQLGAAIKHGSYDTVAVSPDFVIKPVDGFGSKELIRQILAVDRPDAVVLFTDPRFFIHVWEMEEEIHQVCPIAYWHLWDNGPAPRFNDVLYESTDLINCISWPTYEYCRSRWPEKANYVPHALPSEIYHPLPDDQRTAHRRALFRGKCDDHFIGLWVNRNARRKQPGDVVYSWSLFLKELERRHGHRKATLVMHTDPLDSEGTNLYQVVDMLGVSESVFFSVERFGFEQMNALYNACDFVLTRSSAEGLGLSTLEAMQCGLSIVALKTGGLTRQVVDHETGEEHGVAVPIELSTLSGSLLVPTIWDDYCANETFAAAIMKLYEFGPEKRRVIGAKAREYVLKNYSLKKTVEDWDNTLSTLIERWRSDRVSVYRPWEVRHI